MDEPAVRPAWYTTAAGPARDWISVLHPPYTAWHLGYVLIGAGLATSLSVERLLGTLLAFALAVGVAAHGFDELNGRPLGTTIPARLLAIVSGAALAGAIVIGVVGIHRVGWGLAGFVAAGAVLVVAYNLELFGGRLHSDTTFALAWGSFPVLTAYYAQAGTLSTAAVLAAVYAYGLSLAQRHLSTEARRVRRRVVTITGQTTYRDGSSAEITRDSLLRPIEQALAALSWSTCALGVALVVR